MPQYEDADAFDPPAPVVRATLRDLATGGVLSHVPLLIDTGADVTLLPQSAIDALGVTPQAETAHELSGFDGATSVSRVVRLELIFLDKTFRGDFVLIDGDYGILGRNILNNLHLRFDGPRLNWDEAK